MKEKRKTGRGLLLAVFALLVLAVIGWVGFGFAEQYLYPIRYSAEVQRWSGEYEVDPYLVYAVIKTESGFDERAESHAGARGLMQMTEDTFDWVKSRIAPGEALAFDDLYQPDTAIRFGTYYMAISLQRYSGDVPTAAAAYHSGWGTVDGLISDTEYSNNGVTLDKFPYAQMNNYVNKINRNYQKYQELYA